MSISEYLSIIFSHTARKEPGSASGSTSAGRLNESMKDQTIQCLEREVPCSK